jgi:hypothetical protein
MVAILLTMIPLSFLPVYAVYHHSFRESHYLNQIRAQFTIPVLLFSKTHM